jgi:ABC-2 type transport system permease protein
MKRWLAAANCVAMNDLRLLIREPAPYIILTLMPLAMIGFIRPVLSAALVLEGHQGANGSEQAVPGMAIMFAFFLVPPICFNFFREHGWNTWERLRASRLTTPQLLLGKTLVPLAMVAVNVCVVLTVGTTLFHLTIHGSTLGFLMVAVCLVVCVVSYSVFLAAVSNSLSKLNAIANLSALVFTGLGGALTPFATLPEWARSIASATPAYWAMRGFRSVIFKPGLHTALTSAVALLGFSIAFALVAAWRFDADESRTSW